jgi:tryptophan synthase alpha chain
MIEIGMPFSDPIADGPAIQHSNQTAIANGLTLSVLFEQIRDIRRDVQVPLILMGYLNPVLQYGMERFCRDAQAAGIDGLILPDLPMHEYETRYRELFRQHGLTAVFLITPQTPEERIRRIDGLSEGFIYAVSTDSTTGRTGSFSETQEAYFRRIAGLGLRNPVLIGFGIHNAETFAAACRHAPGAIVGSAFIKAIEAGQDDLPGTVRRFVAELRG